MTIMCKNHFLTLVAKDAIVRTHGAATKQWPDANFWAMVSTVKSGIEESRLPKLMQTYNIAQLSDYSPPEVPLR